MVTNSIYNKTNAICESFLKLPKQKQEKYLQLLEKVRVLYLHCEKDRDWEFIHYNCTQKIANRFHKKASKKLVGNDLKTTTPIQVNATQEQKNDSTGGNKCLSSESYCQMMSIFQNQLQKLHHDPDYIEAIIKAFQDKIVEPLKLNVDIINVIFHWVSNNSCYLPLGKHLLEVFKKDMLCQTENSKFVKTPLCPEAISKEVIQKMSGFLEEAAKANSITATDLKPPRPEDQKTAIMLTVKDGAGGHTAPAIAITNRLRERGWRVEVICYDKDLEPEGDPFVLAGVTFEDGQPMTRNLYTTRWKMQKRHLKEGKIVSSYVEIKFILLKHIFKNRDAKILLDRILPLKPSLIFSTISYDWMWQTLAYRIPYAKTIAVSSDVFFAVQFLPIWHRQQDLPESLRQIHFTVMTDEVDLLNSAGKHHDNYYKKKHPDRLMEQWNPRFENLKFDSQMTMIGAPTHAAFNAKTDSFELERLRTKWGMREGEFGVCISRGRLGYTSDLKPAIESYRTNKKLSQNMVIHVVCGENTFFYEQLKSNDPSLNLKRGEYGDLILGPNIRIIPHPLRTLEDFGEIRSFCQIDDIKGGGASSIEGWLIRFKSNQGLLFVTPGPDLYWENTNCEALERWGVAKWIKDEKTNKIETIEDIMLNGLPKNVKPFVDWVPLFDKLVDKFASKR